MHRLPTAGRLTELSEHFACYHVTPKEQRRPRSDLLCEDYKCGLRPRFLAVEPSVVGYCLPQYTPECPRHPPVIHTNYQNRGEYPGLIPGYTYQTRRKNVAGQPPHTDESECSLASNEDRRCVARRCQQRPGQSPGYHNTVQHRSCGGKERPECPEWLIEGMPPRSSESRALLTERRPDYSAALHPRTGEMRYPMGTLQRLQRTMYQNAGNNQPVVTYQQNARYPDRAVGQNVTRYVVLLPVGGQECYTNRSSRPFYGKTKSRFTTLYSIKLREPYHRRALNQNSNRNAVSKK